MYGVTLKYTQSTSYNLSNISEKRFTKNNVSYYDYTVLTANECNTSIVDWWKNSDGEVEVVLVPVQLCPPKIPNGLT